MKRILLLVAMLLMLATPMVQAQTGTGKARTTKTKRDGSPDMRYKENKAAKKGPNKKDGTPAV